jgi:transposase InsO family protein
MPWKVSDVVNERMRFVLRLEDGERITDLCREFGISRKTGHKLWARYKAEGPTGLYDQSRKPDRSPRRIAPELEQVIVELRKKHPTWGPIKLRETLVRKEPDIVWPGRMSFARVLSRNGLATSRPRRRHAANGTPLGEALTPNDIWCADFKGQFQLGNETYCYPLTITDAHSRFLLCCEALENTRWEPAKLVFEQIFRRFGLPKAIRTDNGPPFSTRTLLSLSRLSVWWRRLGVLHERIEPGHPEQNGRHERMHLTLKREATRPAGANLLQQQERFDAFVKEFNEERPHQALGNRMPREVYVPSDRAMPAELKKLTYPLHDLTRRVAEQGHVCLRRKSGYRLSPALAGECVGLRETEDGRWLVTFADLDLGWLNEKARRFEPIDLADNRKDSIDSGPSDSHA